MAAAASAPAIARQTETRVDAAGVRRPAYVQRKPVVRPTDERILGTVTCVHGDEHTLHAAGVASNRRYWLTPVTDA
jgi:hypothetical protein